MDLFYNLSQEESMEKLKTTKNGLKEDEVQERLENYGSNEFKEVKGKNTFQKFIEQFSDFLVIILIVAAVISGLSGELADAIIILIVVIVNAIIGVVQENKAEASLKALKKMAAPTANVIRDGISMEIPARELVPGDIILLEAGKYVPADLRIIESSNLKIEESSLTGESVPVEKNANLINDEKVPLGDRKNIAFMSSMVTYGRGKGVVIATGMDTEIGKIADMISNTEEEKTPLQNKLAEVGKYLGIGAIVICAVMFIVGILEGRPAMPMFMTAVSLAVAAIPEGLPAVVTIVLAVGVQKMIKRNAIIRKLPAVETLGCATVICSDKTGTLTQNKMTVMKVFTMDGYADNIMDAKKVVEIINLCNDTQIVQEGENIKTIGDPTETALIDLALKVNIDKRKLDEEYPRVDEIPFDSDRKLMTTFNRVQDGFDVNVKGAPDILISKCKYIIDKNGIRDLTSEDMELIKNKNEEMAKDALRVLAAAFKKVNHIDKEHAEEGLIFAGLVGMMDPPREEVKDAVKVCKKAGIRPVMITGDHKTTAVAIASELGILEKNSRAITGAELEDMTDEELIKNVKDISVYARVSPEHKVRIVKAWKANGDVVAMTGDGVNDAPALKIANIGAAMGITGTDVAKEAADMVLTDDNFATIVSAVEEGRTVFSNIKKSITYLLSCNIGEIITLFLAILLKWPEPLLPVHILWVNLVTDSLPALALGMEPPEEGVMNESPRNQSEGLFGRGLGLRIVLEGIFIGFITLTGFYYGWKSTGDEKVGRTMAFFILSLSQLVHSYNMRYENKSVIFNHMFKNKYLNWATAISAAIQFVVLFTPFTRRVFKVELLDFSHADTVTLLVLSPLVVVEIGKAIRRHFKK